LASSCIALVANAVISTTGIAQSQRRSSCSSSSPECPGMRTSLTITSNPLRPHAQIASPSRASAAMPSHASITS
jgi:hypothetical protein